MKLGIKTIAEFVENSEAEEKIKNLGIDCSLGYFISKPQPDTIIGSEICWTGEVFATFNITKTELFYSA